MESGRIIIQNTMALRSMYNVFVFGQYFAFSPSSPRASFIPSEVSLWPHQSIVYKRELHNKYGEYNALFRHCADQIFFAEIRKYEPYFISNQITTLFFTDGLSSSFSFAYSKELWRLYRILRYNIFKSLLLSFILPSFKAFLKLFLPKYIFINYKQLSLHTGLKNDLRSTCWRIGKPTFSSVACYSYLNNG